MDLYLSRLLLDPRSRAVRRDLADCQALHRTVMSGFPDLGAGPGPAGGEDARARLAVLHRLDVEGGTGLPTLVVQSRAAPDWSGLADGYLLTAAAGENPARKPIGARYDGLRDGALLRFRLRANPTKRLITPPGPDGRRPPGKRVDLRREEDRLDWLRRKGDQAGFALLPAPSAPGLPDVRVNPEARRTGGRGAADRAGGRLAFGAVLFEGRLRVTDADLFRRALVEGIGSGKAYGFGLLSVAPGDGGEG